MSITVEFKDFNEMLAFSEQLLGRTDESLGSVKKFVSLEENDSFLVRITI